MEAARARPVSGQLKEHTALHAARQRSWSTVSIKKHLVCRHDISSGEGPIGPQYEPT
jgi:hypothetical protein